MTLPKDEGGKKMETRILTTTDINIFKKEYDRVLAHCHLGNFGKIYYYENHCEPLEIDDVIRHLENK